MKNGSGYYSLKKNGINTSPMLMNSSVNDFGAFNVVQQSRINTYIASKTVASLGIFSNDAATNALIPAPLS
jgi:hypothetical protein